MNYTFVYTYFLPVPCINLYEQFSHCCSIDTEKSKISYKVFTEQEHKTSQYVFFTQYNN